MPPPELFLPAPQLPRVAALLRVLVEDFEVLELLAPTAPFSGAHRWLQIRKTGISTPAAARRIAALLGCEVRDIGYAGLKDERSVSEQWFSVPAPEEVQLSFPAAADLILLQQVSQPRKLRRGTHQGNRFRLRLKKVSDRIKIPSEWTFPNYFGARRFGVDNVERAEDWLRHRRKRRISPFKQGIYLDRKSVV